jgi:Fe-S cluster assembly protein SufD
MLERQTDATWLDDLRRSAMRRLERTPFPRRTEEAWRFTDLELLAPGSYAPPPPAAAAPAVEPDPVEASVVMIDGAFTHAIPQGGGLVLEDLEQAEDARARLGRLVGPNDFFTARSLALASGGFFLRVPAGLELADPVVALNRFTPASAGRIVHPRHVIVVEEGASLIIDDLYLAGQGTTNTLISPTVELFVGAGARVRWLTWQGLERGHRYLAHLAATLGRDASLTAAVVSIGGDYSRTRQEVVLAGEGAESALLGAYFPTGEERVEHWTVQDHRAPRTRSDLLHLGALGGEGRSLYYGTIRIDERARGADAYQANKNLLLSPGARANTNPQLEIATSDVRCTHGATVGPVDADAVFYLMSRGVPRAEAEQLVVEGFFSQLLDRLEWTGLRDRLAGAIRRRLCQGF